MNTLTNSSKSTRPRAAMRAAGLVAALVLTIAAVAAPAQARTDRMLVHVPFAFVVGKVTLPAGDYYVQRRTPSVLELRSADTNAAAVVTTTPLDVDRAGARRSVTFNRYGDKYFLAAVQSGDGSMGLKAVRTAEEQRLAKSGARPEALAVTAQ